jgi:DNA-binding transcriptional MerR regulator
MAQNVRLPLFSPHASPLEGEAEGVAAAHTPHVHAVPSAGGGDDEAGLMQIGDLARETGKTVRAIHLYEEMNLLMPAARSKGRYRLYSPAALTRIRWIGKLQDMGFSLTDIQQVVRDWENGGSASGAMRKMREVYTKKLEETRAHLRRLQSLEREIEASLNYLDTCDICDPERLLSFCKACDLHGCEQHVPELVAGFRASCS